MEFKTLAAMLATQASDGQKVTVRDTRQSYIYLKNRPDLVIDNVNVFETPVSSDRWVAEKAVPTWDEAAIVSALGYTPEDAAQKGEPNGYAELDADGKVPLANMPASVFTYKGAWNASTNTPTLADGTGTSGDTYRVSVAGSRNLGSGSISFQIDDRIVYNGTTWEKWDANDAVQSVHGRTGPVVAQAADYSSYYDKWPVGSKLDHFGATAPTGFLACDGAAVSRATYAALFAVISTTYGVGDGSTTFNLPDARGLVAVGAGAHGSMTRADASAYNGGSVGASRNDQMQGHKHNEQGYAGGGGDGISNAFNGGSAFTAPSTNPTPTTSPVTDSTNGTPRIGNETRPAEIAVLVCIKY